MTEKYAKNILLQAHRMIFQRKKRKAFSLVEVLLAGAVFSLLVTALVGAYLYGEEATMLAGNRARAVFLAEEGLEAARNIRDADFANLSDGTYGLSISGNQWNFSGASDTQGIFTRSVTVAPVSAHRKSVMSTITWQQNAGRTGTVSLVAYLTNWQRAISTTCANQADFLEVNASGATLSDGRRTLSGITIGNTATNCTLGIGSVTISWTSPGRRIYEVFFNETSAWAGNQPSGTSLDIADVSFAALQTNVSSAYRFNGNMAGDTFSITYTMSDATTKTVSGITP